MQGTGKTSFPFLYRPRQPARKELITCKSNIYIVHVSNSLRSGHDQNYSFLLTWQQENISKFISITRYYQTTHQSLHTQEQHIRMSPSPELKHGFGHPWAPPLQGRSLKAWH